ncbi:glycosyltransferase family 2 protein [Flavihumibacter sp. R14]|nr:glycosyltransferase family 2 protein [Flavihumibacter soli]
MINCISVLILTKNEEQDLPGCLSSVSWCDDIHVFDSFSNDRTKELAENAGARVCQRVFDNYSAQRNAALRTLDYKYSWLLILDADERIPPELVPLLSTAIKDAGSEVDGFRIRRRDFLGKSWLKNAQISPFYVRLVRHKQAEYHREINEVIAVKGQIRDLQGFFDHYPFSKGYSHWLNKHNQYSAMEAKRWMDEQQGGMEFSIRKALFSKDFSQKRYHQKGLFYKLPGRPVLKWLYMVIWRRAFLDGRAGFIYATLQSIYEYFIILKARELLEKQQKS